MRQLNKTIKYLVGRKEDIGSIPYGAIITNAKLIFRGDSNDALIFLPKKVVYEYDGETGADKGCESLCFAEEFGELWTKAPHDWINL
jgi:hypothetical protein